LVLTKFSPLSDNSTFHALAADDGWFFELKGNRVDHLLACSGLQGSKEDGRVGAVGGVGSVVSTIMVKHETIV